MITLGLSYEDKTTGFVGVAMSRTEYLYGSVRVGLQGTTLKDGKPLDWIYFDEQALVKENTKKSPF